MARKLSKWCSGCKCSTCRWQGTDNCLHDQNSPCSSCLGRKSRTAWYIEKYYQCEGYVESWEIAQERKRNIAEVSRRHRERTDGEKHDGSGI